MGYELNHVEGMTPDEEAAHGKAVRRFDEAVRTRDAYARGSIEADREQDRVETAYVDMHQTNLSNFFLTEIGAKQWRAAMKDLGMTTEDNRPVWPTLQAHGLDSFPDDREGVKLDPRERTFLSTLAEVRRVTPDGAGIGAWKLETRDGWWVSPRECTTALGIYVAGGARSHIVLDNHEIEANRWRQWITFLRQAVERGGFTVT